MLWMIVRLFLELLAAGYLNQETLKLMMKCQKKLLPLLIILGGSEFVRFQIVSPDIFIGSVEDLSLHFHLETGSMVNQMITMQEKIALNLLPLHLMVNGMMYPVYQ